MIPQSSTSATRDASAPAGAIGPWRLVELLAEGEWSQVYAACPLRVPGQHSHASWKAAKAYDSLGDAFRQTDRSSHEQATNLPHARTGSSLLAAPYAIKLLAERHAGNAAAVECLRREAAVARQVRHPRLIHLLDARVDGPPHYLVMPRLPGASLDQASVRRGLSVAMSLCVVRQVAEALAALHEQGWIHADVKPGNIMVSAAGQATLIDLGFARQAGEARDLVHCPLLGAVAYLAPEAFTSTCAPDARSDLYSLGVVLFELLAGQRPFAGTEAADCARQHLTEPPPNLRRLRPQLPREVVRLVEELLAKEPLRRPHLAKELTDRLVALEILTFDDRAPEVRSQSSGVSSQESRPR